MIRIDGYAIDVAVSEEHSRTADVTEHEVERGSNIADHVRVKPAQVTVTCVVSDTPIGKMVSERGFDGVGFIVPSDDARAFLLRLLERREAVTIETSVGTYDNMVLVSITEPRNVGTGKAMRFSATFREIRFIDNERTVVPVSVPSAARRAKKGAKVAPTPDKPLTPSNDQSIASRLIYGTRYGLVENLE
jgi:hypothetical protein